MGFPLFWLALVPACKKQVDPVDPLERQAGVEQGLQVVAVSPGAVVTGAVASVTVVGSGFQPGATVRIGAQAATAQHRSANQLGVTVPPLESGVYDVLVTNPDGSSATLTAGLQARSSEASSSLAAQLESCRHVVLPFASDSDDLAPQARAQLESLLPCFQSSSLPLRVEGHADERGTTDYNVSLAQRRALGVRDLMVSGGVQRDRLLTTSYGEERPADPGSGESAWAKNRRVEISIQF